MSPSSCSPVCKTAYGRWVKGVESRGNVSAQVMTTNHKQRKKAKLTAKDQAIRSINVMLRIESEFTGHSIAILKRELWERIKIRYGVERDEDMKDEYWLDFAAEMQNTYPRPQWLNFHGERPEIEVYSGTSECVLIDNHKIDEWT